MKIFTDWKSKAEGLPKVAYAIGSFDGVHEGHKYLLDAVHQSRPDLPLGVITFEPPPKSFFRNFAPSFRIMNKEQKRRALQELGVSVIHEIAFDEEFSRLTAEEFMQKILIDNINAGHIGCGEDFAFGKDRKGNQALLKEILPKSHVGVTICPAKVDGQGPLSSTRIRRYLCEGDMARAQEILGRPWSLMGVVVHGDQRGRTIGFPTANIELGKYIEPARGAYICAVRLPSGKVYPAITNVGCRPTVDGQVSRVETHLLDFEGDLYGQELEIMFLEHLRGEKRFSGIDSLKEQISKDEQVARQWFKKNKIPSFLPTIA